jgi:hypothetical protein
MRSEARRNDFRVLDGYNIPLDQVLIRWILIVGVFCQQAKRQAAVLCRAKQ